MQNNVVAAAYAEDYQQEKITAGIRSLFERLSLKEWIDPAWRVLLKPNLLMKRRPEEGTTTHPAVMRAIIVCLRELGVQDITIADSPGGPYTPLALGAVYESTGMRQVAVEEGVRLNRDFGSFVCSAAKGGSVQSFTLINPVKNADFIIDVAKLKTHGMTTLSGAVKNLFGTVPGLMKPEFHWRFPEREAFCGMLVDLCETVRPGLCIVDAVVSMEGDGPSGGTLRNTGMLLAAENPYAMDLALCQIIGVPPEKVATVRISQKRGLCPKSVSDLELIGDPLRQFSDYQLPRSKSLSFSGYLPKFLRPAADRIFTSRPVIRKNRCVGCGKCAESCPAKTIIIAGGKAQIEQSACIRCYCCHEMCPVKAIDIRRFWVFNI